MAPRTLLISTENAAFQRIEALKRNRTKRTQQRVFFVEGVRPIDTCIADGWAVEAFIFDKGARLSRWGRALLDSARAETHYALTPALMQRLSDKEDPSEVVALVRMPTEDLARIPIAEDMMVVVFDRPSAPGNLGTVIRSAEAFGASGVIVTGHAADLYDTRTIRASVGSLFSLPCVHAGSNEALTTWLAGARAAVPGLRVIGSSARAEVGVADADLSGPLVLVIGNEKRGMSAGARALCDEVVSIPMRGTPTSINAAAAASILLYEADRQRRM